MAEVSAGALAAAAAAAAASSSSVSIRNRPCCCVRMMMPDFERKSWQVISFLAMSISETDVAE